MTVCRRHTKKCKKRVNQQQVQPPENGSYWKCSNCEETVKLESEEPSLGNLNKVFTHLYRHVTNEAVICPISNCHKKFDKYQGLNNHKNFHKRMQQYEFSTENLLPAAIINDLVNSNDLETPTQELPPITEDSDSIQDEPEVQINTAEKLLEQEKSAMTALKEMESNFSLKMAAKHCLPVDVINEILQFSESVHSTKIDIIILRLKQNYIRKDTIPVDRVTRDIKLLDNVIGLKEQIATDFKREKYFRRIYEFIEPERIVLQKPNVKPSFFYQLPVTKSLMRYLKDSSLRKYLICEPVFSNTMNV